MTLLPATAGSQALGTTGILVPAYFAPDDNNGWTLMTQAVSAQVPITAILNPNSGPVATNDPNYDPTYPAAIASLQAEGGQVIGYIDTLDDNQNQVPLTSIENQVTLYKSLYPNLNGIFVDDVPSTKAQLSYYQSIYTYIKQQNPNWKVVGNPGTTDTALKSYLAAPSPAMDQMVTFEDSAANYSSYAPASWQQNYNASSFGNIVYTIPSVSAVQTTLTSAINSGAGSVYLTNYTPTDTFDVYAQLPATSYWNALVSDVAAANQSITVPALQTSHFRINPGTGILVERLTALNIQAGGAAVVDAATNHANRQLLVFSSGLTLAGSTGNWTGRLDLTNNDLNLAGASLADVTDQIREGFNAGTWNGPSGIVSSSAAGNRLTAIGVVQNNQSSGSPIYSSSHLFDGIAPGASDVLVKFTYFGDTNLDGKVDASDYSRIDSAYLSGQSGHPMTGWFNGDFNYDGVINGSDYTLIDNTFNTQGASLAAASVLTEIAPSPEITTAVPEPAGMIFLAGCCVVAVPGSRSRRDLSRPMD